MRKVLQEKPWKPLSIEHKGKQRDAEFYVESGIVYVQIATTDGWESASPTQVGADASFTARMLAREAFERAENQGILMVD